MVGSSSLGLGSWGHVPRAGGASLPQGAEELLARAVQRAGIAAFLLGPASGGMPVLWVNDAFSRLTGYATDEVVGRRPQFLSDLLADQSEAEPFRAGVLEGREVRRTVQHERHDGSMIWVQLTLAPVEIGRASCRERVYDDV